MAGILSGKSALVTGGASGIGRATALAMVREGARVVVADQSEAGAAETVAMINSAGGQAIAIGKSNLVCKAQTAKSKGDYERKAAEFPHHGASEVIVRLDCKSSAGGLKTR